MKGRLRSHHRKIVFVFSGHQMTHFSLVGKGSFSLSKGKKERQAKIEHMDKQRLMEQELGINSGWFKFRAGKRQ